MKFEHFVSSGIFQIQIAVVIGVLVFSQQTSQAQVADPVLSISSVNTSSQTVTVTVNDLTINAAITYTTNGVNPTTYSTSISSGGTILVSKGTTLKVQAFPGTSGASGPSNIISSTFANMGAVSSSSDHTIVLKPDGTA